MQQEHIQHENDNISEGKDLFSCTIGQHKFYALSSSTFLMLCTLVVEICAYKNWRILIIKFKFLWYSPRADNFKLYCFWLWGEHLGNLIFISRLVCRSDQLMQLEDSDFVQPSTLASRNARMQAKNFPYRSPFGQKRLSARLSNMHSYLCRKIVRHDFSREKVLPRLAFRFQYYWTTLENRDIKAISEMFNNKFSGFPPKGVCWGPRRAYKL